MGQVDLKEKIRNGILYTLSSYTEISKRYLRIYALSGFTLDLKQQKEYLNDAIKYGKRKGLVSQKGIGDDAILTYNWDVHKKLQQEKDAKEYEKIQRQTIEYVKRVGKISVKDLRKYVRTLCSPYSSVGTIVTHTTIQIVKYGRENGIFHTTSEGKHTIVHYKVN